MVEWNRDTPWRQGFLLGDDAIDALELRHATSPDQTIVVVATHDCDLAQDPQAEPVVEVVVGCLTAKDGNYTHAKNPRKLHVAFGGNASFWVEFEATAKARIDKLKLNEYSPRSDVRLSSEDYAVLQMWLASRYRRSAFPDEFERRLTSETRLAGKIANAVKPHGELIIGVFFDVDEGEDAIRNGPDDTYKLDITILHEAAPDFAAAEIAAGAAAEAIEKAFKEKLFDPFGKWQHIELRLCEPMSESVLTYEMFKQLKRWRLEHISLAAEPQQPVLAE